MALVSAEDLELYLQRKVRPGTGDIAIRVAEGWLRSATRLDPWPFPVPEDLFSWCIELAAIAHSRPDAVAEVEVGPTSRVWELPRRAEILAAAAARYGAAGRGPRFAFPLPVRYPTPSPWPGWFG